MESDSEKLPGFNKFSVGPGSLTAPGLEQQIPVYKEGNEEDTDLQQKIRSWIGVSLSVTLLAM